MKNRVITLISFCLFCFISVSCSTVKSEVAFGFKIGNNRTWFNLDTDDNYASKKGFVGGVFACSRFNKNFKFQVELIYTNKGAKINDLQNNFIPYSISGLSSEYQIDIKYIDIPFIIQYMLFSKDIVEPYFYLGGAFSHRIEAYFRQKHYDPIDKKNVEGTSYAVGSIESGEYSFVVGAGLEIQVSSKKIVIDTRFTKSMVDLYTEGKYVGPKEKLRNATLSLTNGIIL